MPAEVRTYHPVLLPRNGEFTAWGLSALSILGLVFLNLWSESIPLWVLVLVLFLLFAALSISLGNWMDRKTRLEISENGVSFENGLRKVALDWLDVQKVQVAPTRLGKSVTVIGDAAHFTFRAGGEVSFQGKERGKVGFVEGQDILQEIVEKSGVTLVSENADGRVYYARP
jgi:hypothetical protein